MGCFVCAALVRNTLTQAHVKTSWASFQKLSYFCLVRLLHQAALQFLQQAGFQADRSTWNNLFQLAFYLFMAPALYPTPVGCRGATQLPLHRLWRALLHCPVGQGIGGICRDVLTLACFISRRILTALAWCGSPTPLAPAVGPIAAASGSP